MNKYFYKLKNGLSFVMVLLLLVVKWPFFCECDENAEESPSIKDDENGEASPSIKGVENGEESPSIKGDENGEESPSIKGD